jgi:hypothetical protein
MPPKKRTRSKSPTKTRQRPRSRSPKTRGQTKQNPSKATTKYRTQKELEKFVKGSKSLGSHHGEFSKDIYSLIADIGDFHECDVQTDMSLKCPEAFKFTKDQEGKQESDDCTQYCKSNCKQWLPNILKQTPAHFEFITESGHVRMTLFRITSGYNDGSDKKYLWEGKELDLNKVCQILSSAPETTLVTKKVRFYVNFEYTIEPRITDQDQMTILMRLVKTKLPFMVVSHARTFDFRLTPHFGSKFELQLEFPLYDL